MRTFGWFRSRPRYKVELEPDFLDAFGGLQHGRWRITDMADGTKRFFYYRYSEAADAARFLNATHPRIPRKPQLPPPELSTWAGQNPEGPR